MDDTADTADTADIGETFGATWLDDTPGEFLADLTGIENRMAGSAAEARAAELVADAFESVGLDDVRQQSFGMQAWERGETNLRLTAPQERQFEAIALPYSPSGSVSGKLVDVGHGTPEEIENTDVAGRIAVASTTTPPGSRFLHRMEKFGTAAEAGAEAFVFVNHVPGQLPPTGSLTFGEEAEIPAIGVSKETGERLRRHTVGIEERHDDGVGTVEIAVSATTTDGESQNVLARTGPETDRELLAVAHYDAHDIAEGALDNGCGIATLVTTAQILADTDLDVGVRFAAVGCEEVGLLGANHLAQSVDLSGIAGVLNIDGAGRFRNLVAMTHTSEATAETARAVSEDANHPIDVVEEPHPFSDQWPFVRRGVPALQLHSRADDPAAAIGGHPEGGVGRGRGWGHTHADTLDKVDDRNVREHAMLASLLLRDLAASAEDLPRLDTDSLRESFREESFEPGMRAAGMWPEKWQ
jgi:Zn-dependent M28 family amino/carboxypeptidase